MRVLGMLSGTSFDGMDYFVGDFAIDGDTVTMRRLAAGSAAYVPGLRSRLREALPPNPVTAEELCVLDTLVGQAFADTACSATADIDGIELIASHGQTVYHWVDAAGAALGTLQIGNPAWIAEASGLPVVSDIRSRDVAAHGQGAPLVSVLDVMLLGASGQRVGAVNLGGISNITVVADGMDPIAYDIGPANALLDAAVSVASQGALEYDEDARLARTGRVDVGLLERMLAEPYYAKTAPKSTGKELFNLEYLNAFVGDLTQEGLPDLLATLVELTCRTVVDEIAKWGLSTVYFGGGGTENPLVMQRLRELAPGVEIATMDALGIHPREKEAAMFALIGFLSANGLPGNIASCTGATGPRILGSFTPGRAPLTLPAPSNHPVHRLRVLQD